MVRSDWQFIITGIVLLSGTWLTFRSGAQSIAMARLAHLEDRIGKMERNFDKLREYAHILRQWIIDEKPPPPPGWPDLEE